LAELFFNTSRRIGLIYMNQLLRDDNPDDLVWLLTIAEVPLDESRQGL
jgi:hypothetical protein